MSGLTYDEQTQVRKAVKEYLEKNGMTSLRKIAKYVREQTKLNPAPTTVSRLVRDFGYDRPSVTWHKNPVKK